MATAAGHNQPQAIGRKRSLRFRDLVLYGIVLIQPTAPMPSFGVIYQEARGHAVTAILLAMVAMLFTSVSYGRMARVYPHGGSAFLYVGKEIHPSLGYLTGWCLVMDYVLNPLICTIWCSRAAINFLPEISYVAWAVFFALLFTLLNCNGVETSARLNAGIAAALGVVIVLVLVAAVRWLLHLSHPGAAYFMRPFYDPATFFLIVNAALLLANVGSGMASQLGAARLLYAMGQDGALPRRFFGAVHPKNRIPRNNVLLIGAICLAGALVFSYQLGTELLNYGALLAFMGVNLASMLRGWRHGRITQWAPILVSLAGLITCALLWWNLGPLAKAAGTSWALVGVLLWIVRRRSTVLPGEAV